MTTVYFLVGTIKFLGHIIFKKRILNRPRKSKSHHGYTPTIEHFSARDNRLGEIKFKQNADKVCSRVTNYYKIDHWSETLK